MKFGIIKSKIDKILVESYGTEQFKNNILKFKQTILANKKLSKLYYLYDNLSSKRGLNESVAKEFLEENVNYFNSIKLEKKDINILESFVGNVKSKNNYQDIDNVLYPNILNLESKIESKKNIIETLKQKKEIVESKVQLPISSMVKIANNTFKSYLDSLDESVKQEVSNILNSSDDELKPIFENTKEKTLEKLNMLNEDLDEATSLKLQETIDKVKSETYNKKNYVKLVSLYESL